MADGNPVVLRSSPARSFKLCWIFTQLLEPEYTAVLSKISIVRPRYPKNNPPLQDGVAGSEQEEVQLVIAYPNHTKVCYGKMIPEFQVSAARLLLYIIL